MEMERGLVKTSAGYVHYRALGQGKPVVLMHVNPQSSLMFLELMQVLAAGNRRAIAIDYPGYGNSDHVQGQPTLVQTVNDHNQRCGQAGLGDLSGELFPLNNPPYYAVELWPGGFTHGGARRNGNAQILNVDGVPIRGLYGAGEFGSVNGMVDASSGSLVGECIAFGRLAGEHAASLGR